MNRKCLSVIIFLMLAMPLAFSQKHNASDAARKKEQINRENRKAYEKARKMTLKHRREIQTKETRKRMDEADRRALAYNSQNDKKWWEKILKRNSGKR